MGTDAERGADKAFEARDTQPASKSDEGADYQRNKAAETAGESINKQGNEQAGSQGEPGRDDDALEDQGQGRESAPSTGRLSSSVAPSDPIDDESPHLPTP